MVHVQSRLIQCVKLTILPSFEGIKKEINQYFPALTNVFKLFRSGTDQVKKLNEFPQRKLLRPAREIEIHPLPVGNKPG